MLLLCGIVDTVDGLSDSSSSFSDTFLDTFCDTLSDIGIEENLVEIGLKFLGCMNLTLCNLFLAFFCHFYPIEFNTYY